MKSVLLWSLVALNVVLVTALLSRHDNAAMAQRVMRPADYLIIPGEVPGGVTGVVYILDASNGLLSAMAYEDANGELSVMAPLDLTRIFDVNTNRQPVNNNRRGR